VYIHNFSFLAENIKHTHTYFMSNCATEVSVGWTDPTTRERNSISRYDKVYGVRHTILFTQLSTSNESLAHFTSVCNKNFIRNDRREGTGGRLRLSLRYCYATVTLTTAIRLLFDNWRPTAQPTMSFFIHR